MVRAIIFIAMRSYSKPKILYSQKEIAAAVDRLASLLTRDYHDKDPILIGILKGSFVFLADLIRRLDFPLEIDFVRVSSYGSGAETSGKIKVVLPLRREIRNRAVLLIEDIVDSGLTTTFVLDYVRRKKPASLKLCSLMDKPSRRQVEIAIDYPGFTVPNRFLVGYGLDYDEQFRHLPDVCALEEE